MGEAMLPLCFGKQQAFLLFVLQIVIMILMATLTTYGPEASIIPHKNHTESNDIRSKKDPMRIYPSKF